MRTLRVWLVSAVCLVAIPVAGCGGEDSASEPTTSASRTVAEEDVRRPPKPDIVVIVVETTVSGGGRKSVKLGEPLRLQVIADVSDEVHVHGYDRKVKVAKGRPATLAFTPDVPGVFEVELESKGLKLLDLVVR